MIRFVDLGKQLAVDEADPNWPRQFAFYDTVGSRFVVINGWDVFDSLADLLQEIEQDETIDARLANRLLGLTPEWVRRVPARAVLDIGLDDGPRYNKQVFGIKG